MQSNWLKRAGILSLGTSLTAIASTTAIAQDDFVGFEEIVVTAQKREQSIQDVPISISTLSGEKVSQFSEGGADIKFLAARIPGVNAESSNGRVAPRFYIRGLGNSDFDLAASQPVSIVMDDVVMENVVLKSFPLFDIERVEVLRGPQGTLFGRNTPAGIIKFDTVKPSQETEGYVKASFGTLGTGVFEGAVGGALSDVLSARVSALWTRQDDWIDNGFTGEDSAMGGMDDMAGRIQLLYTPNENIRALFNLHGRTYDGTAALFRDHIFTPGTNDLNDNFDWNTVYYNDTHNNPQEYDSWGSSFNLAIDLNDTYTITSITAYETADGRSLGDIDGGNGPAASTTQDAIDDLEQVTEELRISGQATEKLYVQAGLYYFDSDFTIITSPFFIPSSSVRHTNETWALFGQAAYDVSEATTVTVGARYTEDDKTLHGVFAFGTVFDTDLSGEKFTWDVAVNHAVNDDLSVFAKVATGFRAPTIQGRDIAFFGVPTVAKEETVISYEAGFKATLLDGLMRWNGAAYYWDVDGLQVTAVGGAGNNISLLNAEKVIGYGVETDLEVILSDNLTLTGGFAWTPTKIKDDNLLIGVCTGCLTITDPIVTTAAGAAARVDGNPLPNASKYTLNVALDYAQPLDNGREVFFSTDWAFQGKTNFFLFEAAEAYTKNTFEGGFRAGLRWNDGQYEVALFGRNITNEANVKGIVAFNAGADVQSAFVGEPRVVGVSFSSQF
ncbi:TonB-dependent receptor [Gimibacter soli]|uniref:TonB-dependent receptor n=1 Tax=Gimibacter soli TaxID=3024400 RepID=A0AAE9XSX7_9PROT|nr:TonB-dependent receptor [Gimibacter soli]WCL53510.1 TonB-dependent receptor [Gimibacter soli]